ncbi:hypothetical protein M422DRAFT_254661 [Sphaerobolus stellatus SS14]|uniref:DUF6533 domain-containing protein n=1 Tax=Sphaerobolus stellatus (strain SS14) TaxID=990650 RepID=A0A0C9V5P6_SPHS4|nr:hypothetical protein M422DRAFT_254661 [Sphaerobolus stellatus SS14]
MDPSLASLQAEVITGFSHLLANKYYVLASTVLILYDHMLTFDQEREFIWKRKITLPTCLFLIFRYVTPIVSALNLIALNWPGWKGSICNNWIWLPVAVGPIISAATGIILIMRVYAIYARNKWVLSILASIYLAQLAVMGWSIPAGSPAPLPPGFIGCVPSEKEGTGRRLSALYIAALCFDASADLSAINAPFASIITAVLVARLFMNLREAAQHSLKSNANSETLQASYSIGVWQSGRQPHTKDTTTFAFSGYDEFEAPLSIPGQDSEGGSSSQETYGPSNEPEIPNVYELQTV